jgi:hypothetical protein
LCIRGERKKKRKVKRRKGNIGPKKNTTTLHALCDAAFWY